MAKRNRHRQQHRSGDLVAVQRAPRDLSTVDDGRGWVTVWAGGAHDETDFQRDVGGRGHGVQRNWTVNACQTLIAGDMGKMSMLLMKPKQTSAGTILERVFSAAFSPVLRKPNGFQTFQQFVEFWILSKLSRGNAYILKGRDDRNVVRQMFVLHPDRCTPMIAPNGEVFYDLKADDLAGVPDGDRVIVPASEIIHDRFNCLFHPLVGLSPLFASALAASQSLTIQEQSQLFFANSSRPGGMLVTPQVLQDDLAKMYKRRWEENFSGHNRGRTAVLGNGLTYTAIAQNAVDSELVKQMDMTAQHICSTFHVPGYKVGVGTAPTYQNAEIYDQIYYDSCIQVLATAIERLLDDGLGLDDAGYTPRFDLDDLIKMDSAAQTEALNKAVGGGWMAPNEARAKRNMGPVTGGNSPMMQQQQFSLEALAQRDQDKPFAKPAAPPPAVPAAANDDSADEEAAAAAKEFVDLICKGLDYATA